MNEQERNAGLGHDQQDIMDLGPFDEPEQQGQQEQVDESMPQIGQDGTPSYEQQHQSGGGQQQMGQGFAPSQQQVDQAIGSGAQQWQQQGQQEQSFGGQRQQGELNIAQPQHNVQDDPGAQQDG